MIGCVSSAICSYGKNKRYEAFINSRLWFLLARICICLRAQSDELILFSPARRSVGASGSSSSSSKENDRKSEDEAGPADQS